ncbi:MAG: TRAP transporter substrate-binding protein DctP [Bdellovibrionales bacterium]|jgi:TRAP-type C4-dicarboxylate transport system substrate-binding protein|nr:TRAP transporter substrate-binding protein DctP [Bdellovibrionales bacterium]
MKFLVLLFFSLSVSAKTFKVGVLAPEGTAWSENLKKLTKEVKKATEGRVKFKIYYGGAQGDEPDVLRKIRVRQLHGGVFTGKTLGDINGDVRVIELPFTFIDDREKAWKTLNSMKEFFNKTFEDKGFKNLGFFEIGQVYFVSQKKTDTLDSLKGIKIWSWQGDELVTTLVNSMNLVSVPLPLPDVLSSLSTGVVEAAYAPPLGIVALQWNTKIKYIIDFPLAYSIGAFLINKKEWDKVSDADKKAVTDLADTYIAKVNLANVKDNKDALSSMKELGVEFLNFPEKDLAAAKSYRKEVLEKLTGNLFSKDALSKLEAKLKDEESTKKN